MSIGSFPRKFKWLTALSLLVISLALIILTHRTKDGLRVVFLDVGQGDCAFLTTPSGHTILIDGGGKNSDSEDESVGVKIVEPFLRSHGVNRIDLMVLTHPHDDHIQGLVPVLRDFQVVEVLDPGIAMDSPAYRNFISLIRSKGLRYHKAVRGQIIDFRDGVFARVLNPPAEMLSNTHDDENNGSIVLRFTCGKNALLMTGDAEIEAEEDILRSGERVESDLIKIGHHGSMHSTGQNWIESVHPKAAVISVGRHNQFGHPSSRVLNDLSAQGVRVFRTDRNGAISATFSGNDFTIDSSISMN